MSFTTSGVLSARFAAAWRWRRKASPWVSRYIDLFKFDQLKPEYLAINPNGVVPTLVHDGAADGSGNPVIINEYIEMPSRFLDRR